MPLDPPIRAVLEQLTAGGGPTCTRCDGLIHGFLAFGLVAPKADAALGDCAAAVAQALG